MLKALVHREQGIEFGLGQRQVTLVPGYWAAIGNAKGTALGSVVCRPSKQNEELRGRQLRTMSMRLLIPLVAACLCVCPTLPQLNQPLTVNSETQDFRSDDKHPPAKLASRPLQLEMRVQFDPTAFPSGPQFYVMYEL